MKSIFITGSTGFVGSYFYNYFKEKYVFHAYDRKMPIDITQDIVLHFAGKAHDLYNISNADIYYEVNTELTKKVFDQFLLSEAKTFIFLSSVKAVADHIDYIFTEDQIPSPQTHYGKSKLLAEQYILSKKIPVDKRFYILRPCMIHGPGNKGNLNLLHRLVKKNIPWPLGKFHNSRSFCSIDNLCFIIQELIENPNIQSGVYNVADTDPLSTNELVSLIAGVQGRNYKILFIPKLVINFFAKIGDSFNLPVNSERLNKLTQSYVVSNSKILNAIKKDLPVSTRSGLIKTLKSFDVNDY